MGIFNKKVKVGMWITITKCKCQQMVGKNYLLRKITKTSLFGRTYHIDDKFCFKRGSFKVMPEDKNV